MRKIIQNVSVSLDGYIEGPDHDISWHRVDADLHQYFNDFLGPMSAFLGGRVTHELMVGYWPTVGEDPDSDPAEVEFAQIWRDKPKIVYSRTRDSVEWATKVEHEVVAEEVQALKEQPGGDMSLGGANLGASFRRLGLVDEYHLFVNPVVLGGGTPLFAPGDPRTDLRLAGTKTFGNGVVMLRYLTGQ